MLKLLISEGNEELRLALAEQLQTEYTLKLCSNGEQAMAALADFAPQLWVLDLMLPLVDGVTLLQEAEKLGIKPVTLVTLTHVSDYIVGTLHKYSVAYAMSKPCRADALAGRLQELAITVSEDTRGSKPPSADLPTLLLELGFSPKVDGFSYLLTAIPMYAADPRQGLTKELYTAVGHPIQKSGLQVERCIRTAIQSAYNRSNGQAWAKYFPTAPDGTVPRPTNGELIARIATALQQSQKEHIA